MDGTFAILRPKVAFAPADSFAFVALTRESAGATRLEILIIRVGANGEERVISRSPLAVADPKKGVQYANRIQVSRMMGQSPPGSYILRIVRGDTTLAEGHFTYTLPHEIARVGN